MIEIYFVLLICTYTFIFIYIYIYIIYIYIYIHTPKKVLLEKFEYRQKGFFFCNLFQKVKLSYILDSLHVK